MIIFYQHDTPSIYTTIYQYGQFTKDLTGYIVQAAIDYNGKTVSIITCNIIDAINGFIEIPLTSVETTHIGAYSIQVRLEKDNKKDTWQEFFYIVIKSGFSS